MKVKEKKRGFIVLLFFEDAKKKGKVNVSNIEEFRNTIFRTFKVENKEKYIIEYSKDKKWVSLPENIDDIPFKVRVLLREKTDEKEVELKDEVPDDWVEYSNQKFGISIKHPKSFIHKIFDFPGQPLTTIHFVNPNSPVSQILFSSEDHPTETTVSEFFERSMESLKMIGLGTYIKTAKPNITTLCGMKALWSKYKIVNFTGSKEATVWQGVVTFNKKRSFSLQTIVEDTSDPCLKISQIMFQSLKIFQSKFSGSLNYYSLNNFTVNVPSEKFEFKDKLKENIVLNGINKSNKDELKIEKYNNEKKEDVIEKIKQKYEKKDSYSYNEENLTFKFKEFGDHFIGKLYTLNENIFFVTAKSKNEDEYTTEFINKVKYWDAKEKLLDTDYVLYNNPEFNFTIPYPCNLILKEHADVDPVVTMKPFMKDLNDMDHFEISVSCRGLPEKMQLLELYRVLKQEYEQNQLINLKTINRNKEGQFIRATFQQKIDTVVMDYNVNCFLVSPDKCITIRSICLEFNENRENLLNLFTKVHEAFSFDKEKIENNKKTQLKGEKL